MQKKSYSWGIIVLMMFLFFPVAIYMIIKKMTGDKYNYAGNGKALKIIGYVLVFFAVIYLVIGLTDGFQPNEDGSSIVGGVIICELIFGGGGALCLYKGFDYSKKGKKYERYVSIVNASNDLYIDNIAAAVPTTYEKAVVDLQSMIDAGYFMNSYIDQNKRELVMKRVNQTSTVYTSNNYNEPTQAKSVKCQNCGATNTIAAGQKNECEYCGSPL